ncbi:hypothetical protein [Bradyrhizobium neotropicale]|uniref:hypothetical protein n=1 Tax=Bradyrhizobium neotropicale TaxID=1497615 RepID=UPI001AD6C440|nr:hypothetical protein [Bradyrhizobium neotropicale]MBO4228048.1 hypothetical protein [Bradyrhizobium neotropicale]
MGYARTLDRSLDADLIARIEASGRPMKPARTVKVRATRHANTYRGARRNASRGGVWKGAPRLMAWDWPPAIRLNRSRKWPEAASYADARRQARA